jgi:hypothetical protein
MNPSTTIIASRTARIVIAVLAMCAIVDWFRPAPAWSHQAVPPAEVRGVAESWPRSGKGFMLELGPLALSLRVDWLMPG